MESVNIGSEEELEVQRLPFTDGLIKSFESKIRLRRDAEYAVNSLDFSLDDSLLLVSANNETLSVYDTATGKREHTLMNPENGINCAKFLKTNKHILCSSTISLQRTSSHNHSQNHPLLTRR